MKKILLMAAAALTLVACHRNPHFITDKDYRDEVHADYEARVSNYELNGLQFDTLCRAEREAMEFLYAYMPLSDLADYEPAFFLEQVRYAFKAREAMPWGKEIPEDVFRHFVLVYRVNNENLDTARRVFFNELKERVQGLTMEEAALEVNHWCHEHVAYRASDSRTSAPLATMRTALGRCGEESTFAVTALRSVGIPARQCYTPRWAHCDDNHAWVEVYVDGEWKFLGACEPDPRLNMGWFSVPSTRCMMVHSKAFGKYKGDEEVVKRTGLYSELNLLSHYAPTRRVTVTVQDEGGKPLTGIQVKFKLYNYAEYYTLATMTTDADGQASLTTGRGDLLIWATDGERYSFKKMDVRKDSTLTLVLSDGPDLSVRPYITHFDIVPPAEGSPKTTASDAEMAANALRLVHEDSLRNAYTATFPTPPYLQRLEGVQHLNKEQQKQMREMVHKSEGNYEVILHFILKHGWHEETFGDVYDYLKTFSEKDLRDITAAVLEAHWNRFDWIDGEPYSRAVYQKGILPARISNEMVRPYRKELSCFMGMNTDSIRRWVVGNIAIDDTGNYYNCPISPVGVYKLRHADAHSRDIFFVAACRAASVPAYLDNATNTIYCWNGNAWQKSGWPDLSDLSDLSDQSDKSDLASLTLTYHGKEPAKPLYWPHFTLAKLENGDLRTFDFEDDPRMASFPATIELEPGIYCLSTGNRYPDGEVRSRLEFFTVEANHRSPITKEIVIPAQLERIHDPMTQHIDPHLELFNGIELWDYAGKTGMLYINLGDYGEPSKHLVAELENHQKEMKAWGGMTYMVVVPDMDGIPLRGGLANTDFAYNTEPGGTLSKMDEAILSALQRSTSQLQYPIVTLIDKEGKICYFSAGYKIGVVEQVLRTAKKKRETQ